MAGALSQRVRRAKIAILGADIPILNPVRVAEEFAMLDNLTGGRIIAGLLRGIPTEYLTYGTNPAESRARFEEALEIVVRAWTEPQPFGWVGRYYDYRTVSIWPRPVQQPHPPIYMSGSSSEATDFAAVHRVAVGFAATTLVQARTAACQYRRRALECGWTPDRDNVLYRIPVHVAKTDEEARATLEPDAFLVGQVAGAARDALARSGYRSQPPAAQSKAIKPRSALDVESQIEHGQLLLGSPATVVAQIERIQAVLQTGVVDLHFPDLDRDGMLRAVELVGRHILPRVQPL
jgi:alkanesulfonate monooxygenase SsuD/methylene tetrahydromethanopterin reductase-like flavin-dependent oxidoreductase (luciferase family)